MSFILAAAALPSSVLLAGSSDLAFPVVLVVGGGLIGWYLVGQEIMRRRARRLAIWCKRAVDPFGGRQAVRWPTFHSFTLEVKEPKAPLRAAAITGLTESWDVPMIWYWNRRRWRRDMVLLELTLRRRPVWGLELWRPRALLAGDARRRAEQEGWPEEDLDGFRLAAAGDSARALASALLADLDAERRNLVRCSVRRAEPNLTLALNVPDPSRLSPDAFHQVVQRLAGTTLRFTSPGT